MKGHLKSPPAVESSKDGSVSLPESPCKLAQEHDFPAILDLDRVSSVFDLLLSRRPPHVPGLVPAVVVDPVDRVLRGRCLTDVDEERREVAAPFRADRDPSERVALGVLSRRSASSLHPEPRSVLLRCRTVSGVPMRPDAASATRRFATHEVMGSNQPLGAAVAPAEPLTSAPDDRVDGDPSAEPRSCQVLACLGHGRNRTSKSEISHYETIRASA